MIVNLRSASKAQQHILSSHRVLLNLSCAATASQHVVLHLCCAATMLVLFFCNTKTAAADADIHYKAGMRGKSALMSQTSEQAYSCSSVLMNHFCVAAPLSAIAANFDLSCCKVFILLYVLAVPIWQ